MESLLTAGDQIFLDSISVKKVINENYEPPLGQPSSRVNLTLRAEYSASYASGEDLTELASTVLNASLPEGMLATNDPITFESLDSQDTDANGITRWTMRVSRELRRQVDTGKVIPLVQGRSMDVALAKLEDHLDIPKPPEIRLSPDWWPWLPLIPFNISVETR